MTLLHAAMTSSDLRRAKTEASSTGSGSPLRLRWHCSVTSTTGTTVATGQNVESSECGSSPSRLDRFPTEAGISPIIRESVGDKCDRRAEHVSSNNSGAYARCHVSWVHQITDSCAASPGSRSASGNTTAGTWTAFPHGSSTPSPTPRCGATPEQAQTNFADKLPPSFLGIHSAGPTRNIPNRQARGSRAPPQNLLYPSHPIWEGPPWMFPSHRQPEVRCATAAALRQATEAKRTTLSFSLHGLVTSRPVTRGCQHPAKSRGAPAAVAPARAPTAPRPNFPEVQFGDPGSIQDCCPFGISSTIHHPALAKILTSPR